MRLKGVSEIEMNRGEHKDIPVGGGVNGKELERI